MMMKYLQRIVIVALLATFVSIPVSGQDWGDRQARRGLSIGPGFHGGASMILDAPNGFKIKPTFAWRAEVHATYPIVPTVGIGLGLGVDRRGTLLHFFNNDAFSGTVDATFFSIHPHFVFSGFSLGMNFGLPIGETSGFNTFGGEAAPTMIESRLGGVIPIHDDETGWLSIVLGAGYSLNPLVDVESSDINGNWNHVSAHLGLRYEFAIPDTERQD